MNDADGLEPVSCTPWTSRLPKMAQPDLDYIGKFIIIIIIKFFSRSFGGIFSDFNWIPF